MRPKWSRFFGDHELAPGVKVPTSISLFGNMTFAQSPTSTRIGTISQESGEAGQARCN